MSSRTYQLCLPLTDAPYILNAKGSPRPIPPVVRELFELSDSSPSGLVWKVNRGVAKAGKPAGSKAGAKWLVPVYDHGLFYTHRIVYYLRYGQNPGHMIVRHTDTNDLVLGWADDNGRDERGVPKPRKSGKTKINENVRQAVSEALKKKEIVIGSVTQSMYRYGGVLYNMKSLCDTLGLKYMTIYQRVHKCNQSGTLAFALEGVEVEEVSVW